jgi:hypothetical protein
MLKVDKMKYITAFFEDVLNLNIQRGIEWKVQKLIVQVGWVEVREESTREISRPTRTPVN